MENTEAQRFCAFLFLPHSFPPSRALQFWTTSRLNMSVKRSNHKSLRRFLQFDDEDVTDATLKLRLLKNLKCTLKYEKQASQAGAKLVAGVDEVGRGCLFGPVVAAAVILNPEYRIRGLRDSKLLDQRTREKLVPRIRENCLACAVAVVGGGVNDRIQPQ